MPDCDTDDHAFNQRSARRRMFTYEVHHIFESHSLHRTEHLQALNFRYQRRALALHEPCRLLQRRIVLHRGIRRGLHEQHRLAEALEQRRVVQEGGTNNIQLAGEVDVVLDENAGFLWIYWSVYAQPVTSINND